MSVDNRADGRVELLKAAMSERVLVLDGAMGTAIQARDLTASDFGGAALEGCNEHLVVTRPDVVRNIHDGYLGAGADIVETNTFGSTSLVLAEYGLQDRAYEITRRAAELAREAADAHSARTPRRPRFVAGAMGPTTKAISVTGGVTFDGLVNTFHEQAKGLVDGGVDYLLLETCQDTRNIKAGIIGIRKLFQEVGRELPVAVSVTIEPMGTMLAGQSAQALAISLQHVELLYLGLNCATGPTFMTDHVRTLSELVQAPTGCVPNAGLPDEDGHYVETPDMIARVMERFLDEGWLNVVGGCCGTTPEHIRALVQLVEGKSPRRPPAYHRTYLSGVESLEVEESNRPVIVGERTNVIGSRKFKRLIVEERFEEASEIARQQVKSGAQVIDLCLANPDREEGADMARFLQHVIQKVKVPLMIDSTDERVIEPALTFCQGKAIINSVNLEDGEERFQKVVPIARAFGAALVVGTIDEDGMAVTRKRKVEVAKRSHDLLVHRYGVPPGDIIFDPLVFPCATGDAQYIGSAAETIEAIRLIKEAMPHTRTILGVSNVSFGLPPAGREVMNSVFLYHCTQAGLDMAIVNSEKLERYASIPDEEKRLAADVLFRGSDETIAAFAAHFRDASSRVKKEVSTLTLDERLANYIVEGSKDGLVEDLDRKLRDVSDPLEIINGPLMAGMDEVGRLFNDNELIVAEVLQSAEAMKAAVGHLEPLMEKTDAQAKGTVILATVKGDVHDIGKNLVDIILSNNGYKVINLGIKVPPADLIGAVHEHQPDIIGLSGLLVKSAQQMVVTAHEFAAAGVTTPMLVGGAALTNSFTRRKIATAYPDGLVAYAADAMKGLDLAAQIRDEGRRTALEEELHRQGEELEQRAAAKQAAALGQGAAEAAVGAASAKERTQRSDRVPVLSEIPQPPDLERHVLHHINQDEVWRYINPVMLYNRHLGLKTNAVRAFADGDPKAAELKEMIDGLQRACRGGLMEVHAVWQFFRAASEGNQLHLYRDAVGGVGGAGRNGRDGNGERVATFEFPRQPGANGLCLSDYAAPLPGPGDARQSSASTGATALRDTVCMFVVTAGKGIRALYQTYKDRGDYLLSHAIQALAIETAEGTAEWLHEKIRGMWGFPDDPAMSMKEKFQARYRGCRYSFGYPACPDLGLQRQLFDLLRPEGIGVELTEEHMMEPEASVSALVFHHPEARYFDVDKASR